jgi:HSP20 family protein
MRLVPYRKYEAPARFWPEASELFESILKDFPFGESPFQRENGLPAVDVMEKDGNLILKAELPGMEEKDIELTLEGNVLTLKGERKLDEKEERSNFRRVESYYGSFSRSFSLPDTADRDKIKADYKNGVLTITIPHKAEMKPREIPVSSK